MFSFFALNFHSLKQYITISPEGDSVIVFKPRIKKSTEVELKVTNVNTFYYSGSGLLQNRIAEA